MHKHIISNYQDRLILWFKGHNMFDNCQKASLWGFETGSNQNLHGLIMDLDEKSPYTISWIENLSMVDQSAWDSLAVPMKTPFLEWEWLRLMETSGSITAETGWQPHHLTVWSGSELIAAAPLNLRKEKPFHRSFWAKYSISVAMVIICQPPKEEYHPRYGSGCKSIVTPSSFTLTT